MGWLSSPTDVGAARLTQVADAPFAGQLSLKVTNKLSRPDLKNATPVAQLLPMEGSPVLRPIHSTELTCWPASVVVTGTSTPGAAKFSYPIAGPGSSVAGAGASPVNKAGSDAADVAACPSFVRF